VTANPVTSRGVLFGQPGNAVTSTAALANGQLVIGSTGASPVAANLTAGANITITNGPGTITIAAAGGTSANKYQKGNMRSADYTASGSTAQIHTAGLGNPFLNTYRFNPNQTWGINGVPFAVYNYQGQGLVFTFNVLSGVATTSNPATDAVVWQMYCVMSDNANSTPLQQNASFTFANGAAYSQSYLTIPWSNAQLQGPAGGAIFISGYFDFIRVGGNVGDTLNADMDLAWDFTIEVVGL
jgi:hypothetical protein